MTKKTAFWKLWVKKEKNAVKSQEVSFQKSQKLLASRPGKFAADKSRYGDYITRHWNWMNSYWMFWIGFLRGARSVSSFCDFWKLTFWDLTAFSPFWHKQGFIFFEMFLFRSIKVYLCANMINFDGVNFSERRSEKSDVSFDAQCM